MRIIAYGKKYFLLALLIAATLGAPAYINAQPGSVPPSFAEVIKRVEPAVVSIEAKSRTAQPVARNTPEPGNSDDILEFFRRQLPRRPIYAVGSGFIVDRTGYVITNNHVVADTARLTIKLDSGEEFPARIVGTDEETDLAVLKIDAGRDLPFIKLGDSTKVEVGDWVLALGSPFGLAKSVSAGIVSQTQRDTPGATVFQRFIQTDAVINPGNSGGPLVNMAGEVIGVNSQIATQTGEFSGVGFAFPSSETSPVYQQIVAGGRVRRGYLGAILESVKDEFARVYGLSEPRGAVITDIRDKLGPAGAAGLANGDIILDFGGQKVQSAQDLIARVAATPPDRVVRIGYLRESGSKLESRTADVKLGERPSNSVQDDGNSGRRSLPLDLEKISERPFGLTVAELTPTLAATYKLDGMHGVVIREVDPASFIADIRNSSGEQALGPGDLILRLNRVEVKTIADLGTRVAAMKIGDPVVLHIAEYNSALRSVQTKIVQFTIR